LTHLYKGVPAITEMEETARKMGHSVKAALLSGAYTKVRDEVN
jgi:hypothetical protein